MTILNDVKELVEIDIDEGIYDRKLILHINSGVAELVNNAIPISKIDVQTLDVDWKLIESNDYQIICDWLYFYVIGRLERPRITGRATSDFIEKQMTNLLYQLKAKYDKPKTDDKEDAKEEDECEKLA